MYKLLIGWLYKCYFNYIIMSKFKWVYDLFFSKIVEIVFESVCFNCYGYRDYYCGFVLVF